MDVGFSKKVIENKTCPSVGTGSPRELVIFTVICLIKSHFHGSQVKTHQVAMKPFLVFSPLISEISKVALKIEL